MKKTRGRTRPIVKRDEGTQRFLVTYSAYGIGPISRQVTIQTRRKAAEFFGRDEEDMRLVAKTRDGSLFLGVRTGNAYYVTEVPW